VDTGHLCGECGWRSRHGRAGAPGVKFVVEAGPFEVPEFLVGSDHATSIGRVNVAAIGVLPYFFP
jgi:hypothetical protein